MTSGKSKRAEIAPYRPFTRDGTPIVCHLRPGWGPNDFVGGLIKQVRKNRIDESRLKNRRPNTVNPLVSTYSIKVGRQTSNKENYPI